MIGKRWVVVALWVDGTRVKHRTYRAYARPEDACDVCNRLNKQWETTMPRKMAVLLDGEQP